MIKSRKQNSTTYPQAFFMADSSDHVTGKVGLSPTVTLSKNSGSFAAASGAVSEIGNGWYSLAGNATDRNTLGEQLLHAEAGGADDFDGQYSIVDFEPFVFKPPVTLAAADVSGNVPVDVSAIQSGLATDSTVAKETTLNTVSSYLDTEIADIKAKTDLIPASPAAVGSAMTLTSDYPLKTDLASTEDIQNGLATPTNITAATGIQLAATQNEYAPAKAGDVMVVSDKTGFSLSTSGIKSIWDFLTADVTTVISSFANLFKTNIDAKISEAGGGGGLDAAGVRAAIGMSSANLDGQLETILLQISALGTGTGPVEKSYYVSANGGPCGDVLVIMSLDAQRESPIHKGMTDATGWVKFYPNVPLGTKVYMWSFKTGVDFNNPDEETV